MPSPACRLYLITPPVLDDLQRFVGQVRAAFGGGDVAALQVRLKTASDDEIAQVVAALKPLTQMFDVALILNDRPDLAAKLKCDGVHIGQDDASYAQARQAMGRDGIVGVTCHDSRHLAMEAAEAGADYVAFGAFFDTATKAAPTRADPELLSIWQESMETPCVAIGGITVERARALSPRGRRFPGGQRGRVGLSRGADRGGAAVQWGNGRRFGGSRGRKLGLRLAPVRRAP